MSVEAYTNPEPYERDVFENAEAGVEKSAPAGEDLVRTYLRQIGKIGLLNAAQEVELSKQIEAGLYAEQILAGRDEASPYHEHYARLAVEERRDLVVVARDGTAARDRMLEANLRLVVSLAKRYQGRGMSFLDLIQEGNLGLIRAVQKFDYTKGYKFSTYATWWIRQAVTRGLADQARTIRLPVHMVETVNKLSRIKREMTEQLEREPTIEELAEESGLPLEKIEEILSYKDPVSMDRIVGNDDGDSSLGDFISDDAEVTPTDIAIFSAMQEKLQDVLATLDAREVIIVKERFGLVDGKPKTLNEVGKIIGVTRERVRQLETEILAKLRHPSRAGELQDFYE